MNNGPIGVFDSGSGGLSSLRVLRALLPGEDIVFFGDTARLPYGTRTAGDLHRLTASDIRFLVEKGVKAILVACGTVSSNLSEEDTKNVPVPVMGIVEPAAKAAAKATQTGRLALFATDFTVNSGRLAGEIKALRPGAAVEGMGGPEAVLLAEQGRLSPDDPEVRAVLEQYLHPLLKSEPDTLVLGCTHFPLLRPAIESIAGSLKYVDAAAEAAKAMALFLAEKDLLSDKSTGGTTAYYVSGDPAAFQKTAALFLGHTPEIEKVDIGAYE